MTTKLAKVKAVTYSLGPIKVDARTWFYEDKRGLLIVREFRDAEGYWTGVTEISIPWRKLQGSISRHAIITELPGKTK